MRPDYVCNWLDCGNGVMYSCKGKGHQYEDCPKRMWEYGMNLNCRRNRRKVVTEHMKYVSNGC